MGEEQKKLNEQNEIKNDSNQNSENSEEKNEQKEAATEEEPSNQEQEELPNQENKEEKVDQEDLAAQWESQTENQSGKESSNQEDLAAQWEAQMGDQKKDENDSLPSFEDYEKSEESKLSLFMDIPLEVTIEIGSTSMPIEEVLKLNPNSVVELDRLISEPVDLKVNGKLIAKGELYSVKNSFGIKIIDIITPEDRMKLLDKD